jgi:hypothetical protein
MQPNSTNLHQAIVPLTLTLTERSAILNSIPDLPRELAEVLNQPSIRRDRVRISPQNLEFLDWQLSQLTGRSVSKAVRTTLKPVIDQIADEMNLLNSKTSSVAIDNAAHSLFKASLKSKTPVTYSDAEDRVWKLRAWPIRLRGFPITNKDKRLCLRCDLPSTTLDRVTATLPYLNLADVLVIFATRYRFDPVTQAGLIEGLMDFRGRVLAYIDAAARRTVQINRERTLRNQQLYRRTASE